MVYPSYILFSYGLIKDEAEAQNVRFKVKQNIASSITIYKISSWIDVFHFSLFYQEEWRVSQTLTNYEFSCNRVIKYLCFGLYK